LSYTQQMLLALEPIGPPHYDEVWDELYDDILGEQVARHYDREGEPISLRQWAMLIKCPSYKKLLDTIIWKAENKSKGAIFVSTIWLGLDHGFGIYDDPVIFETMAFELRAGPTDVRLQTDYGGIYTARHTTEREAYEGHGLAVLELDHERGREQGQAHRHDQDR
jgi:hypothetical protein